MAQHKALVLFKLNSHAKMAPDIVLTIESQSPLSQAEQLSAFRSASGVGPHDHLVVITFN
jgi:hypothetical protein